MPSSEFAEDTAQDAVSLLERLQALGILALGLVLLSVLTLPLDLSAQLVFAIALVVVLLVLNRMPRSGFARVLFLSIATVIVLRYLYWRSSSTLDFYDLPSYLGTLALYGAEIYGIAMYLLTVAVNVRPIDRRLAPLPADTTSWPSVDVLIPTYNEPVELVKITLAGATAIDYPADKLNIYLLDDGGTDERRNATDPALATQARTRHRALKDLCADLKVSYLTRERNTGAKAGNLNAALPHISGDLVLVLDADHVPTGDILRQTVGHFLEDLRLSLVQTPHFFVNPDPIEKNLQTFSRMPAEGQMFYGAIQPGLDFWGSAVYCGSAALLRRTALDEIRGFSGETVTEDAESSLHLHQRGWRSRYQFTPLVSGLHPETISGFLTQRIRWAQGMVQLFLLYNPLRAPGLQLRQRVGYLSNTLFWFFPFARVIFLFAPALYLVFGLKIYDASLVEVIGYTVPYLVVLVLTTQYLFAKVRWPLVSELYEVMQSLSALRAIMVVIRHPRSPVFKVTPKSEIIEEDSISPFSRIFYVLLAISAISLAAGLWRVHLFPEDRGVIAITMFWATVNLIVLIAGLGALYEHRQRRANPRLPMDMGVVLHPRGDTLKSAPLAARIQDVSVGGASLNLNSEEFVIPADRKLCLNFVHPHLGHDCSVRAHVVTHAMQGKNATIGIRFEYEGIDDFRDIVTLIYWDSTKWRYMLDRTASHAGLAGGLSFFLVHGVRHFYEHLAVLLRSQSRRKATDTR